MKKRFFITTTIKEQFISKHHLSFAACNFSYNLMSGGGFDKVYSILPTFVDMVESEAKEDNLFELVFLEKLRKGGRLLRIISIFGEQWQIFKNIPRQSSVWLYNLHALNFLLVILLRIFKPNVKINVIVLDFTPVTRGIKLNSLCLKLINSADGAICLADSELFTIKNKIVLPGVVPDDAGKEPQIEVPNNKFLLSGVLSERIAQISKVLEAFAETPQCELHITGSIEDESLAQAYIDKYPNIIFHGKVSFSDYLDIMHECTFMLSTRDASFPENQCNFPSKIIEGLLHNRIIVSTIKYSQLQGIQYFKISSGLDDFSKEINEIMNTPSEMLLDYANQGNEMVRRFNTAVWNDAMTHIENA